MRQTSSVERRLILTLLVIAGIAIAGILAILPYRLFSRDIQQATTDAHRLSSVVHVALSHALLRGERDHTSLTDLVNRLQAIDNVTVRLHSLEPRELRRFDDVFRVAIDTECVDDDVAALTAA